MSGWRTGGAGRGDGARGPALRRVVCLGATGAVLWAGAVSPAPAALAVGASSGYDFSDDARRVDGADSAADAERLEPGTTYRSSLPAGGTAHYRLDLDDVSSTYVSATAVPPPDSTIASVDGIKVTVRDTQGLECSVDTAGFGDTGSPHPIAAWGMREISPGKPLCQKAGTYDVLVERVEPAGTSPDSWDLELTVASEPRPAKAGATSPPGAWDSASPAPAEGHTERRPGGAGFATAASIGQGVWGADIAPGGTLFYKVPVDWGQQLSAIAELGSAEGGGGYAGSALDVSLYNPARGQVQNTSVGYGGARTAVGLAPLPPVDHANRHAPTEQVNTVRFAGSYYLVVHLGEKVADGFGEGPFPLTLRVRVRGAAQAGPDYAGESTPRGLFEVTAEDREAAVDGTAAADDFAMTALAAGGIGTGTLLLVGLGAWTAAARRRADAP